MKHRHRVVGLLCLLSLITYLDRVCISVAGPHMQQDLNIGPSGWGWVVGVFAIAYGLFEVPAGLWGDRAGARRVLTRIVASWSVFTALTGAVSNFGALLLVRFLFGAGEAGAYPNVAASVSRWVPEARRARAFGFIWMSSQFGGAVAPFLVVPIQAHYGWRTSFFVFGLAGILWSLLWFCWYRDNPAEMRGIPAAELAGLPHVSSREAIRTDWRGLLLSSDVRAIMGIGFCYVFAQYFFIAWLPTFLVRGRGFNENELIYSSAPFLLGALTNLLGGAAGDAATSRFGLKWGRRAVGVSGLALAAVCLGAVPFVENRLVLLMLLAFSYAGTTFQQSSVWAACVDVGGLQAGTVSALMNTMAQIGSFAMSISFGGVVARWGSYNLALAPLAAMLIAGTGLWLLVDPTRVAQPRSRDAPPPAPTSNATTTAP